MKRKWLAAALSVVAVLCLCLGLASCGTLELDLSGLFGGGSKEPPEETVWKWNNACHWDSKNGETQPERWLREAHTFVDKTCSVCGYTADYTLGLEWNEHNADGYHVDGIGSATDTEIVIPNTYYDEPVAAIESLSSDTITKVFIPANVTRIGNNAFAGCEKLEQIVFAEDSKMEVLGECSDHTYEIDGEEYNSWLCGKNALKGTNVTSFVAPSNLKVLDMDFFGDLSPDSITLPASLRAITDDRNKNNGEDIAEGDDPLEVHFEGTLSEWCNLKLECNFGRVQDKTSYDNSRATFARPWNLYIDGKKLTKIVVPDDVQTLTACTFRGCAAEEIVVPKTVTTIENCAFQDCLSLHKLTVPFIGEHAVETEDPEHQQRTSLQWFFWNSQNKSLWEDDGRSDYWGSSNSYFALYPREGKKASAYSLQELTVTGGKYLGKVSTPLLARCLKKVTLGEGIEEIGSYAFMGTIYGDSIDDRIWWSGYSSPFERGCSYNEFVGGYRVSYRVFESERRMQYDENKTHEYKYGKTYEESGITYESWMSAYEYAGIEEIVLPDSLKTIGKRAFLGAPLQSVTIPKNVTKIGSDAFRCCHSLGTVTWRAEQSVEINERTFDHCACERGWKGPILIVGNNVKRIADGQFDTQSFMEVKFEAQPTCTEIGAGAFQECAKLSRFTFPDTLETIGAAAFSGCTGLIELDLPTGLTTIESNAFDGCEKLIEICNRSTLTLTPGEDGNGKVAKYAKHVYAPSKGEMSRLFYSGDWIFYSDDVLYYLMGTADQYLTEEIVLPNGVLQNGYKIANNYAVYAYAFANTCTLRIVVPSCVLSEASTAFQCCYTYGEYYGSKNLGKDELATIERQ